MKIKIEPKHPPIAGDAVITYKGHTFPVRNVQISPAEQDLTSFTNEQLEECSRIFDAILEKYSEDAYRAFMSAHPNGGTFFILPDGTLAFKDAETANSNWKLA